MTFDTTANYAFKKPTDGNDDDAWGPRLNENFDDIDTELKAVSDVADQAAIDAAAALAAVGGAAQMDILEDVQSGGDSTLAYTLQGSSNFASVIRNSSSVTTIEFTSTLPAGKAVKKTIVAFLAGGGILRFLGTGSCAVICDIGGSGAGNAFMTTQGRHVFEVYGYHSASLAQTIAVIKRIGVATF